MSVNGYTDPWLPVCLRCPLDDCVRPEGCVTPHGWNVSEITIGACAIYRAHERGWGPEEAIAGAEELGLLDEVEWLEY